MEVSVFQEKHTFRSYYPGEGLHKAARCKHSTTTAQCYQRGESSACGEFVRVVLHRRGSNVSNLLAYVSGIDTRFAASNRLLPIYPKSL